MMNTYTYLRLFTTSILLLFIFSFEAYSGREDRTKSIHTPEGGSAVVVNTVTAIDSVDISILNTNQRAYTTLNRISLGVDIHYPEFVPGPQLVEVSVNVKRFDNQHVYLSESNVKLGISYFHHDTLHSKILDVFEFSGAYKMIFEIDSIWVNGDLKETLPKNLYVQGDIFTERYTTLSNASMYPKFKFLDVDCDEKYDGVRFHWPAFEGAEEYQVEFLHISNYGVNNTIQSPGVLKYDFKNNSTRVTTSALYYDIALLFDRGWLAYRVRPVGVDIDNPEHLIFGSWSVVINSGTIGSLSSNHKIQITNAEVHEGVLNWQYSATYAEQGKRKEVITYYDGTLRNRQAVTKVNSEKNVIVGETIYDHQGRAAVTVLPTPVHFPVCDTTSEPVIKYYEQFNKNEQGVSYSKLNFDLSTSDSCSVLADPMSSVSGSSNYYSPSNPNQLLHQKYVPDAEGYPFQQVEYTPDNTGRVNRQSGVGSEFQIGSGKETRYLYGNPTQLELNRIFGSEVGYAEHYQKNSVIDANGQVSVSYLDMAGRVIATALAGASPENVNSLSNQRADTLEVALISSAGANQTIDRLSGSITVSSSLIITSPTNLVLDYDFTSFPLVDSCMNDICVDCVYDLTLSLKDDCGSELLSGDLQQSITGNFQLDSLGGYIFHTDCQDSFSISSQSRIYLGIGKYTVSKQLSIRTDALYAYLDLIDSADCVLKQADFYNIEAQKIDSAACLITCDNCLDQLGTMESFISNGHGSSSEYFTRVQECMDLCKTQVSDCEMYGTFLEFDMSPGGQYGEYLNASTGDFNLTFPLSIYNINHQLTATSASWRNPKLITDQGTQFLYLDEQGVRSRIYLLEDEENPGVFIPAPTNISQVQYDSVRQQHFIYPEQLASVVDFINYFEQSWAKSLITYHPEYCFYESCIKYEKKRTSTDAFSSTSFDDLLKNTNTFQQAKALGFITASGVPSNWFAPTGNNPTNATKPWDPFVYFQSDFAQGTCNGYGTSLVNKFNQYSYHLGSWHSMAEIAAYTIRCGSNLPSTPAVECYNFGQTFNGVLDTTVLNNEWRVFKALYMSAKQELQQELATCKSVSYCSSFNECIGNSSYHVFSFFDWIPFTDYFTNPYFPFLDVNQPCSFFTHHLYKNKIKRFGSQKQMIPQDANGTAYELYLQTGQCPNVFALQHLLNNLAEENKLSSTSYDLSTNAHLSSLFQANNSYYNPGTLPSLNYSAVTTSNSITATWTDVSNSSTFATLTFNKTAPQSWSQVKGITNVYATGLHTFEAEAVYTLPSNKDTVFSITGSITYFELNSCTFEHECKSNQLALDLTTVFNVLNIDNVVNSVTPVGLSNYTSSTMGSSVGLVSLYIENASNSGSNLSFVKVGTDKYRIYNPSSTNNDGLYIQITNQSGAITSAITSYEPMISTGNYSFSMVANPTLGYPVTLSGVLYQIHNGDTIGIAAGDCGLPTPNQCKRVEYLLFDDLQALLKDALINYNGSSIDLYSSVYTTPNIIAAFPYEETHTTSVEQGDSLLIISAGDCDIVLSLPSTSIVDFENLIGITNFETTGEPNLESAYNHFIFIGEFETVSGTVWDTVYGSSCFSIKSCQPCINVPDHPTNSLQRFAVPFDLSSSHKSLESVFFAKSSTGCTLEDYENYLKCEDQFYDAYAQYALRLSEESFNFLGFCECPDLLCDYLFGLDLKEFDTPWKRLSHVINNFSCNSNCKDGTYEYYYLNFEDNYHSNNGEYMLNLSEQEYVSLGFCECPDVFYDYLKTLDFIDMGLGTRTERLNYILNTFNCEKVYCTADDYDTYYQWELDYISEYGEKALDLSQQDFTSLTICECQDQFFSYVAGLDFQQLELYDAKYRLLYVLSNFRCQEDQGCTKDDYNAYMQCEDDYYAEYGEFALQLNPQQYVALGLCECQDSFCDYLSGLNFKDLELEKRSERVDYILMNFNCNNTVSDCNQQYANYVNCVNNFNENYSYYQIPIIPQAVLVDYKYCGCLDKYCNLLDEVLSENLQFATQNDFMKFVSFKNSCESCDIYSVYVSDVTTFNASSSVYKVEIVSEELFNAYGYCTCYTTKRSSYTLLLEKIIVNGTSFSGQEYFDRYVSLSELCTTDQINKPENKCDIAYERYITISGDYVNNTTLPFTLSYLPQSTFDNLGLCNCVEAYGSALDAVLTGIVTFKTQADFDAYIFGQLDCKVRPNCTPTPLSGVYPEMPVIELENDCIATQLSIAKINADNAYNLYIDSIKTVSREKYLNHCLATQERLVASYGDRQHHYTLYYYDIAGNLIKTIPPEGVELLSIYSSADADNIRIDRDRNLNQKTVFTSHRLQTRYEYNSLNQLVGQFTPDTDPMDAFEQTLPNGLHNRLQTNKIQMINSSLGYLAGQVDDRGYFYKTTDGGSTWNRVNNLVSADLKKIKMFNSTTGVAIGEAGTVLKTIDGGTTWDLVNTWQTLGMITSLNDIAVINSSDILLVGDNGFAAQCTNFTSSTPTFTVRSGLSGNVTSASFLGTVYYVSTQTLGNNSSFFYKLNGTVWEKLSTRNNSFSDVDYYAFNQAYASDIDGRLYHNSALNHTDSSWLHISSDNKNPIKQIKFFNQLQGLSLIEDEIGSHFLYRTTNGGKNWNKLSDAVFNHLAISEDQTVAAAVGALGEMVLIYPYVSGEDGVVEVSTPLTSEDFSAVWLEKSTMGKIRIIAADNERLFHTEDALVISPVWTMSTYTTGDVITQIEADVQTSGNIYGVVLTESGKAYRLKKEGNATMDLVPTPFANSDYISVTKNAFYFYLSRSSNTNFYRVFKNNATTSLLNAGTLSFIPHHLDARSNSILVAGNTGAVGVLNMASNGNTIVTSIDLTSKVYPDQITVLKNNTSINKLLAFGNDGLVYHWNASLSSFVRISNSMNERINDAYFTASEIYLVGASGLAKKGLHQNYTNLDLTDLLTVSNQSVQQTVSGSDLHAIQITTGNRLYIAGDNGTLLYSPSSNTNLTVINGGLVHFRGITQKVGSENVLLVGKNTRIQEQMGTISIVKKDIFVPPVTDVHFRNASEGTLIASKFVIRTTTDGGGNWKIVRPEGAQSPAQIYSKVWTLSAGRSLLFGSGNTLLHNRNTGITSFAFTSTNVTAVAKGTNDQNIFIVDEIAVKEVNLSSFNRIDRSTLAGGEQANALHVFANGDHIVVGNGGLYKHFKGSGLNATYPSSGISTLVNLNAIVFKDNVNGIVVGNSGVYYYTSAVAPIISSEGYLQETNWELRNLSTTDPLTVSSANIYTIGLASSTNLILGGVSSASSNHDYPYVRRVHDASGRYSNRFYYDRLGRLVVSRNARQESENKFSYTLYDGLGRVIEAGEKTENNNGYRFKDIFGTMVSGYLNPKTIDDTKLNYWISGNGARKEVTHSYYDEPLITGLPSVIEANPVTQRHRIVHVTYEETFDNNDQSYDHATHYAYDIHGNVKTLLQDNKKMVTTYPSIASQRFKRMDYSYDLLSGNVHRMSVQNGEVDQWHHAYVYDADNRIRRVYTNTHSPLTDIGRLTQNKQNELSANSDWQNDAQYYYYDHGPLARVEIGQNNLQGVDYYYNLQGWLKGVNSSVLSEEHDPGMDSDPSSLNALFAKDVVGFGLHYYENDYKAISDVTPQAIVISGSHGANHSSDLYNGNIRYMQTAITHPETREAMPMLNAYRYDQLNRLNESRSYETGLNSNKWNPPTYNNSYYNAFSYDAMGNILTQQRYKRDGTHIENLEYHYHKDLNGKLQRNRLYHVNDSIVPNVDSTDIDDMGVFNDTIHRLNTHNNYSYDAEGRLVKDRQEEIDNIIWRVDGKVKEIRRPLTSEKKNLIFDYNSFGQRIAKHVHNPQTDMLEKSTYYILDAQGNQLSMYEHVVQESNTRSYLMDRNIYGSSRLGTNRDTVNLFDSNILPSYGVLGNRNYELTNHLGNVLTVVNDHITPLSSDNDIVDAYQVGIDNVYDYSPFGVQLDGRTIERQFSGTPADTSVYTDTLHIFNTNFENSVIVPYNVTNVQVDGWYNYSQASLSLETSGGNRRLKIVSTHAVHGIQQSFAVEQGKTYTIKIDVQKVSVTNNVVNVLIWHNSAGTGPYVLKVLSTNGTHTFDYTALGTTMFIQIRQRGTYYLDNLKMYRTYQDTLITEAIPPRGGYRYGFNGYERDDEAKGKGNSYTTEFRQYDPRLGRWLSLDPRKEKYPDVSPYVTFANNPIIFIDTDGDTIRIVGSKEFKEKTLAALQTLTNDELTLSLDGVVIINQGLDKFKYHASSKIQGIELTDNDRNAPKQLNKGTELLQGLISNNKRLSIEETNDGNKTVSKERGAELLPDGKSNEGVDAKVLWNPNKVKGGVDEKGSRVRPVGIGLGHELIHAKNRMQGRRASGMSSVIDPDGGGNILSNEELNTRKEENELRKEQGITLRKVK